jgi:uncharacterized protein involved in exopolysaccharide biosynthesis
MNDSSDSPTLGAELRVFSLAAILLRRWRLTVLFPIVATAVSVVVVLILPSRYTVETSFVPQSDADAIPASLANLAGQFGLEVPRSSSLPPKFYEDLLTTRAILEQVLAEPLGALNPTDQDLSLRQWLSISGSDMQDSIYRAAKYMRKHIDTDLNRETGLVTLEVTLRDPEITTKVATDFLRAVEQFNTHTRQSQARERRRFVQSRITDIETELREAEDRLRDFYESNRRFRDSPALVFVEQRLQSRVSLLQDLLLTLRQEYETARVDEVNDTPLVTIVQNPVVPTRRSWPRRRLVVIAALFSTGVFGVALALTADFLQRAASVDPQGRDAALAAWRDARAGIFSLLRRRSAKVGR